MVKISVITVTLNASKTIDRCLNSLMRQTCDQFEHIVIDGLSTDDTLHIINKYGFSKVISEKDGGIYDAMNKGSEIASGEYIVFLNADDEFDARYIEQCISHLSGKDYLSCGVDLIYRTDKIYWCPKPLIKGKKYLRMPIPHAGLLVKRSLFRKIGGFNLQFKYAADFDFILRLNNVGYGGVTPLKLVNFYAGGASAGYKIISENDKIRRNNGVCRVTSKIMVLMEYMLWLRNMLR